MDQTIKVTPRRNFCNQSHPADADSPLDQGEQDQPSDSDSDVNAHSSLASSVTDHNEPVSFISRRKTSISHSYKNHGLTLEMLDRLSPSMVTLQTLASEWPPNTVDSGYVPSPLNGDVVFTYPSDDMESFACDASTTRSTDKFATPIGSPNSTEASTKSPLAVTPSIAIPRRNAMIQRVHLPPAAISVQNRNGNNNFSDVVASPTENSEPTTSKPENRNNYEEFDKMNDSPISYGRARTYSCPESSRPTPTRPPVPLFASQTPGPSHQKVFQIYHAADYSEQPLENLPYSQPSWRDASNSSTDSKSINASSGIEACKTTAKKASAGETQMLPESQVFHYGYSADGSGYVPPGGYIHTRNWSTPAVTTGIDPLTLNRPAATTAIPPPMPLRSARSRDAIIDLSGDGSGRRRVLVLALPDVVVGTTRGRARCLGSPSLPTGPAGVGATAGAISTGAATMQTGAAAAMASGDDVLPSGSSEGNDCEQSAQCVNELHSRQSSLGGDSVPPLRSTPSLARNYSHNSPPDPPTLEDPVDQQLEEARARRRAWTRPRALSCDVTMEETAGRALRRIADDFELGRRLERYRAQQTLLTRVRRSIRRSFSRILIGEAPPDTDDEEIVAITNARRTYYSRTDSSTIEYGDGEETTARNSSSSEFKTGGKRQESRQSHVAARSVHRNCSASRNSSRFSLHEDSSSHSYNETNDAFYDLEFLGEDCEGELRCSLTRRGGDDFEYYL